MSKFYAYINRMKHIERWGLMRSTDKENIAEHTHNVCIIAHALALINREVFSGNAVAEKAVMLALYHETSEVITGDLPTPIKYFNANIKTAYKELESYASDKLINMLPNSFKKEYDSFIKPDTDSIEYKLCKGADRLSAYIKCIEELNSGNSEFKKAEQSLREELKNSDLQEIRYFFNEFIPSYKLTLDELESGESF